MNKLNNLLIIAMLAFGAFACTPLKKGAAAATDYAAQGYVKAMVINMELDGCTYMLELEADKKKLEPDGLQEIFQKDSLPVWIKYKSADRMSICMAGETIDLLDIKNR
jgi:hypothetical protein